MFNYGVGGQEVKTDASEGMADLPLNRTMFIQKLTQCDPIGPEAVYDLKTVEDVFDHFQPNVDVEFEDAQGASKQENLKFGNLGDFSVKNITGQSAFLQDLAVQQEQFQKVAKQLKTNKMMQKVMESPEMKAAFMNALQALYQELEENN
jgi:hypothetical protein